MIIFRIDLELGYVYKHIGNAWVYFSRVSNFRNQRMEE